MPTATTLWLPGYEHQPVTGAGLSVGPGAPKVVLHTTETGPGSVETLIAHWRANWGSGLPHFISEGSRYVQLLPLNVGAYTLENASGGADTNRSGPAIQVERVGYADYPMSDIEYDALGKWLADLISAGVTLDLAQHPRFYGANEGIILASYTSPIRLSASAYDAFNGFLGHQHVPENAHWDPGGIDGARIERIARAQFDPTPGPTPPTPSPLSEVTMRAFTMNTGNNKPVDVAQFYISAQTGQPVHITTDHERNALASIGILSTADVKVIQDPGQIDFLRAFYIFPPIP